MKRFLLISFFSASLVSFQQPSTFSTRLAEAALSLTHTSVQYDPTYFKITYPMGDVPPNKGVCTDVVVRAYRKVGIDLQEKVHEDMLKHFKYYPQKWGLTHTDTNIDHRRVPNLMTFFSRFGSVQPKSQNAADYQPGDVVAWLLENNLTHIGIVSNKKSRDGHRYLMVHNIGRGQEVEDCLFSFKIIGHYRYLAP